MSGFIILASSHVVMAVKMNSMLKRADVVGSVRRFDDMDDEVQTSVADSGTCPDCESRGASCFDGLGKQIRLEQSPVKVSRKGFHTSSFSRASMAVPSALRIWVTFARHSRGSFCGRKMAPSRGNW